MLVYYWLFALMMTNLPLTLAVALGVFTIVTIMQKRKSEAKDRQKAARPDDTKEYDIYHVEIERDSLVQKSRQVKKEKKIKLNATDITFAIGILLMLVAETVLVTSSWNRMADAVKILVLIGTVAFVFALSALAKKVFGLNTTSFAMYSLGTLLLPVMWLGISGTEALINVSNSLSLFWNNYAISALLVAIAAYLGYRFYKSQLYLGITYLAATWLTVFMAYHGTRAVSSALLALSALALIANIIVYFIGDKIRSLYVYNYVVTICAAEATLALLKDKNSLILAIGAFVTAIALVLFSKIANEAKYIFPLIALISLWEFVAAGRNTTAQPVVITVVIIAIAALTVVYRLIRLNSMLSEIANALALFIMTFICYMTRPTGLYLQAHLALLLAFLLMFSGALIMKEKARQIIMMLIAGVAVVVSSMFSPDILRVLLDRQHIEDWEGNAVRMAVALFCYLVCVISMVCLKKTGLVRMRAFLWTIGGYMQLFSILAVGMSKRVPAVNTWLGIAYIIIGGVLVFLVEYLFYRRSDEEQRKLSERAVSVTFISGLTVIFICLLIFCNVRHIEEYVSTAMFLLTAVAVSILILKKGGAIYNRLTEPGSRKTGFDTIFYFGLYTFLLCEFVWAFSALTDAGILIKVLIFTVPVVALIVITEIGHAGFINLTNMFMYAIAVAGSLKCLDTGGSRADVLLYELSSVAVILFIVILWNVVARLLYKQMRVEKAIVDYLSPGTLFFILAVFNCCSHSLSVGLAIIGIVLVNTLHRVSENTEKITATLGSVAISLAIVYELRVLPDYYVVEAILIVAVALSFVIRYMIKPMEDSALAWMTFCTVAACMIIEFFHAFTHPSIQALVLLGVVSLGIFVTSFVKREKRWFLQGAAELITMAVYMGISYWGSFVWWIYLLIAGLVTLSLATGNEIRKKKTAEKGEGAKKIFDSWTW